MVYSGISMVHSFREHTVAHAFAGGKGGSMKSSQFVLVNSCLSVTTY